MYKGVSIVWVVIEGVECVESVQCVGGVLYGVASVWYRLQLSRSSVAQG